MERSVGADQGFYESSLGVSMLAARGTATSAPVLHGDYAEEPTNCCGSGCDPCVWEVYHDNLKRYQRLLTDWEDRHAVKPQEEVRDQPANGFKRGDRARLKNFKTRRLLHMNDVLVDVLCEDASMNSDVRRWQVRPVGGSRLLRLPSDKLELYRARCMDDE